MAEGKGRAQYQCRIVVTVLAALGFTLSLSKCQLTPAPAVKFLGFIVDAKNQTFWVPEGKVRSFELKLEELEKQTVVTKREVAQLAGKMISMAPAIGTAPIHSRQVARALVGLQSWDEAVESPERVKEEARLFLELLLTRNGRTRWKKGPVLAVRAVGDALNRAYAAFLPDGEIGSEQMMVPFTEQEIVRMAQRRFSSTEREIRTSKCVCVKTLKGLGLPPTCSRATTPTRTSQTLLT